MKSELRQGVCRRARGTKFGVVEKNPTRTPTHPHTPQRSHERSSTAQCAVVALCAHVCAHAKRKRSRSPHAISQAAARGGSWQQQDHVQDTDCTQTQRQRRR